MVGYYDVEEGGAGTAQPSSSGGTGRGNQALEGCGLRIAVEEHLVDKSWRVVWIAVRKKKSLLISQIPYEYEYNGKKVITDSRGN